MAEWAETEDLDEDPDESQDPVGRVFAPTLQTNAGQVIGEVRGDVVQHIRQYFHQAGAARALTPLFVEQTMAAYVERAWRATPDGPVLDSVQAAGVFRRDTCVFLSGHPGTGRRTAAIALLSRLELPLHGLPIDDDNQRLVPPDQVNWPEYGPAGYLLAPPKGEIETELSAYRQEIRRRNSFLVVLTEPDALPLHAGPILTVGLPDPRRLLISALSRHVAGRFDVGRLAEDQALASVLTPGARPQQVIRLAQRIAAAIDTVGGTPPRRLTVQTVAIEAVKAYHDWQRELADWFDEHGDARARLFLVALAVLEGEPGGPVLDAAESLGGLTGERAGAGGGIAESGILELSRTVLAHPDAGQRLFFQRPAYAPAVLRFVHADRSAAFRARLWSWAAHLPMRGRGMPSSRIATRVANALLTVTTAAPEATVSHLTPLVKLWWAYPTLRPLARDLATAAALSPEAGTRMRERLNTWATQSGATSPLLPAVAEICSGPLADAYPRAAFVRLNNLAGRGPDIAGHAVAEALHRLWHRPQHRPAVLRQITTWLTEDGPRRAAGLSTVAALTATPEDTDMLLIYLADQPIGRREAFLDALAAALRPVVAAGGPGTVLDAWPAAAALSPAGTELTGDLLVRVVGDKLGASTRAAGLLRWLAGWAATAPDRKRPDDLIRRLLQADPLGRPAMTR